MTHHERHNAALTATGIHHTLNARLMRALAQNNQTPGFDNRSLLPCNSLKRIAQNTSMVEPNARNGHGDRIGGAGGIPTTAQANFQHGNVHTSLGKHNHCRGRKQIERGDKVSAFPGSHTTFIHATPGFNRSRNAASKSVIAHHTPINLHAFGITHQVRRRIQSRLQTFTAQDRSRETRCRGLTVGSSNLDAIKVFIGATKLIEHVNHRLKHPRTSARNLPRIGRHNNSLIKRNQIKLKRHRIQPRKLCHSQSPLNIKRGP